jgi:predicted GTPase
MNESDSFDKEIESLNQNLSKVLKEVEELKRKQEKNAKAKADALQFLEKVEKVISLVEQGKIQITKEQHETIYNALLKIQKLFRES